ncbi:MAG TPA: DsbA family protein, partial [Myxococcota bacterium]|nr:DsbA family protein [Myxococcota bacterium]
MDPGVDRGRREPRIDVVSDVVCPWCYVGKRRLEAALRQ